MATEPVREQILAAVRTRLAAIVTGATYWYTPVEVARDWKNFDEAPGFPFYGVIEGQEVTEAFAYKQIRATLRVILIGWVRDDQNRRIVLNRAVADVQRAVFSEESWGGLALETKPVSIRSDEAALVAKPYAYFEVEMDVVYVHALADV
jgi:hypothetical protein